MVYAFVNNLPFEEGVARHCEKVYLGKMVEYLAKTCEFDLEVHFYIGVTNLKLPLTPVFHSQTSKKVCVIIDEFLEILPELLKKFDVVFQAYLQHVELPQNYYHFPLGYTENLLEKEPKPIHERTLDVFFSGSLHSGRKRFFNEISFLGFLPYRITKKIQKRFRFVYDRYFPNSYIRFTNGFMSGLGAKEYTEMLNNSKIVLCPAGVSKIESFRIFEAMKMGCVLVADELPQKLNYEKSPIIQMKSWKGLKSVLHELVRDSEELQKISTKTYQFYLNEYSPESLAEYITR
ncbi:MAG: glycosyltransferase, partial [Cytophagales bacterium]